MDILDSIVEPLCKDVNSFLMGGRPADLKRQKWIRTGEGTGVREFSDHETVFLFVLMDKSLVETDSYRAMEEYLISDPVFSTAPNRAGYWGKPQSLIRRTLLRSMSLIEGKTAVSSDIAKSVLINLRGYLCASVVIYEAKARLLGVELTTSSVPITDNIRLVKMTDKEINNMQPYLEEAEWSYGRVSLLDHDTEVRFTLEIPVDNNQTLPLLSTQNSASTKLEAILKDIISALRLYKPGLIELGPRSASSILMDTAVSRKIYELPVMRTEMQVGISDIEPLQKSYRVIRDCRSSDSVLDRALHRFLLARQRHDLSDRLVDFVIAWESILLTVNKKAIRDELSYRFGINGASVLYASGAQLNRHVGRRLMSTAYSVRSLIVHGASNNKVKQKLNKAKFDSIDSLVTDIEEKFRNAIFWLSELPVTERPYIKSGGWELLLWDSGEPSGIAT